jgi:adenylate cyclase
MSGLFLNGFAMNLFATLSYHLRRQLTRFFSLLASKWKRRFYLYLAAVFTVFVIADTAFFQLTAEMKQVGLDMMVRYRFVVPKPDKDIVIVDIDEASLSEMAREYGRWPWPRRVLADFVKEIEKQQPQAIVFDIVFSDPDIYNAESDAYFDSVIAGTNNTFFPMLRLSPYDDQQSKLNAAMIPGALPLDETAQGDATIALLMPYFNSIQSSGRLGLNNINPDADGITRQYITYMSDYGWKVPSLPLRIAQELNFPETDAQRVFLNWRGPPFSYHSLSFSKVFAELTHAPQKHPVADFKGKIVIIGSTASSLFEIRPTPMSQAHPGVEILATAIDNFKHVDYLRFPDTRIVYFLLTILVIWATAWGFYRDTGRDKIDLLFGASQFILVGISYGSINLSNTYINLTGPVTLGLAYFSIARLYGFATARMLDKSAVQYAVHNQTELHGVLMLINLADPAGVLNSGVCEKIRQGLDNVGSKTKSVEALKGSQRGVWSLFENMLAISWVVKFDHEGARLAIHKDIEEIELALMPLLRKHYLVSVDEVDCYLYENKIMGGTQAQDDWIRLFADTLQHGKRRVLNS